MATVSSGGRGSACAANPCRRGKARVASRHMSRYGSRRDRRGRGTSPQVTKARLRAVPAPY